MLKDLYLFRWSATQIGWSPFWESMRSRRFLLSHYASTPVWVAINHAAQRQVCDIIVMYLIIPDSTATLSPSKSGCPAASQPHRSTSTAAATAAATATSEAVSKFGGSPSKVATAATAAAAIANHEASQRRACCRSERHQTGAQHRVAGHTTITIIIIIIIIINMVGCHFTNPSS